MLQYVYNLQDLRTVTLQLTPLYTYHHSSMGIFNDPRKGSKRITDMQDYSTDTDTGDYTKRATREQNGTLMEC